MIYDLYMTAVSELGAQTVVGANRYPPGPEHRRRWGFAHNPAVAQEIASLDAEADCQRIAYLLSSYEFPFDMIRSLELALFHTFGARRVAALLDRTKQFERHGQKRYDDTNILIGHFIEAGWDNALGAQAIQRMNEVHSRFRIHNDDYLFVLWTFIDFPIDWMSHFGWRSMTAHEQQAWFHFWVRIAERMGMTEIPANKAELDAFVDRYEAKQMVHSDAARRVMASTVRVVEDWLPGPLRPVVLPVVRAMARPQLLAAAGYEPAPKWIRPTIVATLKLRALFKRFLPLERYAKPVGADGYRTYPHGRPPLDEVGPATADLGPKSNQERPVGGAL